MNSPLAPAPDPQLALVGRVNRLFHDLTQDVFDDEHRDRHRVERGFWTGVAALLARGESPAGRGRTIVDLACGTGFVGRILAGAMAPADRLVAIDLSRGALCSTRRAWPADAGGVLVLANADGQALPLAGGSVDLLAMNAALHHVPSARGVLREIDRVLRPGGCFALGFEPNLRHFSGMAGRLSHGFDRLAWYASPRQNARRLKERLGLAERPAAGDRVMDTINRSLMAERLTAGPLGEAAIMDLVDPHARGAGRRAGFDAASLIRDHFGNYEIVRLFSCDYLGEAPRRWRALRGLADTLARAIAPEHGSLFSWVIRKPGPCGEAR
jgi:SAM-dependent methyltransferase